LVNTIRVHGLLSWEDLVALKRASVDLFDEDDDDGTAAAEML
jgi:uncharacterized Fe-S center protein